VIISTLFLRVEICVAENYVLLCMFLGWVIIVGDLDGWPMMLVVIIMSVSDDELSLRESWDFGITVCSA
jgi:hypothetical protein